MQGHRFTETARQLLADALEKASTLEHESVRPEHFLLGLVRSQDRTLLQIWSRLNINPVDLRRATLTGLPTGKQENSSSNRPYTSFSKRVIEYAMREATALNDDAVEPTHILLGVAQLGDDTVADVLRQRGVTADRIRSVLADLRGRQLPDQIQFPGETP